MGRSYTPSDATKEKLFALHDRLGIERCVIVQSTCHGIDNSRDRDALAANGGAYRGVALLPADVDDAELKRLDRAGFRGVRFHFMKHLSKGATIDEVDRARHAAGRCRLASAGPHGGGADRRARADARSARRCRS